MAEISAGAAKRVKAEIVDLFTNANFAYDMMSDESSQLAGGGDRVDIPALSDFTIATDASVDQTADDPNPSVLQLVCDREPLILVRLRRRYERQMLSGAGAWSQQIAKVIAPQMRNYQDRTLFDYFLGTTCWTTAALGAPYHVNVAGASLTYNHFQLAKAALTSLRGQDMSRFKFFLDAYAEAAVHTFPGFIPNNTPEVSKGMLGLRAIGWIGGIPVYPSSEVPGSNARGLYSVAVTASNVATNVVTLTVGAGHGFVQGQVISTSGLSTNITSATITSVTATTIVAPLVASNGSVGTGTVRLNTSMSFLVDTGHVHKADGDQLLLSIVDLATNSGKNLKVTPLYGFVARQGRVIAIGSPRLAF